MQRARRNEEARLQGASANMRGVAQLIKALDQGTQPAPRGELGVVKA